MSKSSIRISKKVGVEKRYMVGNFLKSLEIIEIKVILSSWVQITPFEECMK